MQYIILKISEYSFKNTYIAEYQLYEVMKKVRGRKKKR